MDGNGRWGRKRGKSRNYGHIKGVEAIQKIVKVSIKKKIPILTFYTFSTENWKRPKKEITFLFNLIENYFNKEITNLKKNGVKIDILGNINTLPKKIKKCLINSKKITNKCNNIRVNLAINYGSKNEIINAFKTIKKNKTQFTVKDLEKNLYTKGMPDPDLLIRTGGKKRLSNFLLWQLSYSEIYFNNKLWPDFRVKDFIKILNHFKNVRKNFGKI
jgi:undecaprenyl diphosphate synthase